MEHTNTTPGGIDLDKLEALARAADPFGVAHLVTHYRLSANLEAEEAWRKAVNPATVLELITLARAAQPAPAVSEKVLPPWPEPINKLAHERETIAPWLSDKDIVDALHSLGIDTEASRYGFAAIQVRGSSVPLIRRLIGKLAHGASSTPAGYASKRIDGSGWGSWLHHSRESADCHSAGNGPEAPQYITVPLFEHSTATPASAQPTESLEQQLIELRIAITPENEGGFHALIYGDSDEVQQRGYGATPSEAVAAAQVVTASVPAGPVFANDGREPDWDGYAVAEASVQPTAWLATDLDGRGDVAFTKEEAKRRAGEGCTHFYPLYEPEDAPASAQPVAAAPAEPVAWSYECVQPGTDGKVWSEFFGRDKPTPKDFLRNIAPLYAAPAAPVAPPVAADDARHRGIGAAVERACRELPDGFELDLELENGSGDVRLYDEGYEHGRGEFEGDTFAEKINAAIDAAISSQQGQGGGDAN